MNFSIIKQFICNISGVALIEFAYSLPIVIVLGLTGLETANYAIAHQRVSQLASMTADNASRLRSQMTEDYVNQLFTGVEKAGTVLDYKNHGRIILSSVQRNQTDTDNLIGWQRCFGNFSGKSAYGTQNTPPKNLGIAPVVGSAFMLVEASYQYQPIIPNSFLKSKIITHEAAFVVRQRTDFSMKTGTNAHPCPT